MSSDLIALIHNHDTLYIHMMDSVYDWYEFTVCTFSNHFKIRYQSISDFNKRNHIFQLHSCLQCVASVLYLWFGVHVFYLMKYNMNVYLWVEKKVIRKSQYLNCQFLFEIILKLYLLIIVCCLLYYLVSFFILIVFIYLLLKSS